MTWVRKIRAGLRIALVISLCWTIGLIGLKAALGLLYGQFSMPWLLEWLVPQSPIIIGSGFLLGAFFAAGIALVRGREDAPRLTARRSIVAGALGGLLVALALIVYDGYSPYVSLIWSTLFPAMTITTVGALVGLGVWRTTRHAELGAGQRSSASPIPLLSAASSSEDTPT